MLDDVDRELVNCVQARFPLDAAPFDTLGGRLGIDGDEVIRRLQSLKGEGVIRLIGPVFNAKSLGYRTTLVAMRVAESRLEAVGQELIDHSGIGHCYQREHSFNLWSTLSVPGEADLKAELDRLGAIAGVETIFDLPTLRVFKIGAYFDASGGGCPVPDDSRERELSRRASKGLSAAERALVNELQEDLPLTRRPFDEASVRLGLEIDEFLDLCRSLLERGIMRRYGASVNHRSVGYMANAMACWVAPRGTVRAAAEKLSALPAVSHCYERKVNDLWRHNLFSVVHSHTRKACQETADKISRETGLDDKVLLFSVREFKKVRVSYLV